MRPGILHGIELAEVPARVPQIQMQSASGVHVLIARWTLLSRLAVRKAALQMRVPVDWTTQAQDGPEAYKWTDSRSFRTRRTLPSRSAFREAMLAMLPADLRLRGPFCRRRSSARPPFAWRRSASASSSRPVVQNHGRDLQVALSTLLRHFDRVPWPCAHPMVMSGEVQVCENGFA